MLKQKRLYDIDAFNESDGADVEHMELSYERSKESDFINSYLNNSLGGENNYYSLVKGLNDFFKPFNEPKNKDTLLANKIVGTPILGIVENLDNFNHLFLKNKDINQKRFYLQNYILEAKL